MIHEKTLLLETGRLVKVISRQLITSTRSRLKIENEILIKEPKETEFRLPIGTTHPKFWKLQKLDPQQARLLQIQYSGLSEKQFKKVARELEQQFASGVQTQAEKLVF